MPKFIDRILEKRKTAKAESEELKKLDLEENKIKAELNFKLEDIRKKRLTINKQIDDDSIANDPSTKREKREAEIYFKKQREPAIRLVAMGLMVDEYLKRHGKNLDGLELVTSVQMENLSKHGLSTLFMKPETYQKDIEANTKLLEQQRVQQAKQHKIAKESAEKVRKMHDDRIQQVAKGHVDHMGKQSFETFDTEVM